MRRREFITLIGSAAAVSLLLVPVVRAQEPGRIYKLSVIVGPARQAPRIVAFFDELKGLGFVDACGTRNTRSDHTVPVVVLRRDVRSLARPGGNTTGVSILAPELDGKRQEILMEAVPGARRIAVLADPIGTQADLQALQNAIRARGVEVAVFSARTPELIAPTMDKAKAARSDRRIRRRSGRHHR